jgi:hypothetical protein
VVCGDIIGSSRDSTAAAEWLRGLAFDLDAHYGPSKLAAFRFTRGDEIEGLLEVDVDPLAVVLRAALQESPWPVRWALVKGPVDSAAVDGDPTPDVPATQRTGPAFDQARATIEEARTRRERLIIRTGNLEADDLLAGLTPVFMDLIGDLTRTQRAVARLAVIEGLRQFEVAERLRVRRATISVSFARAKMGSLQGLAGVIRRIYRSGAVELDPT